MNKTSKKETDTAKPLKGRQYQRKRKTDFFSRAAVQRGEDRLRGGRGGRAEGQGFAFETADGEQPAHTVIDAQRDRALAEAGEAYEVPRTNAIRTRDEAVALKEAAEHERVRLVRLRESKRAELKDLEARHAA